jgi:hypothetical protein
MPDVAVTMHPLPQMFLSDGCIRTFEVPVTQFHQLRYKVAKVSARLAVNSRSTSASRIAPHAFAWMVDAWADPDMYAVTHRCCTACKCLRDTPSCGS